MMAAIKLLNGALDVQGVVTTDTEAAEIRIALQAIETCQLALGALKVVVEHPKNPESIAHASRVFALLTTGRAPVPPLPYQPA